eukprot:629691-Hanusia_phi.AAC.1
MRMLMRGGRQGRERREGEETSRVQLLQGGRGLRGGTDVGAGRSRTAPRSVSPFLPLAPRALDVDGRELSGFSSTSCPCCRC